MSNNKTLADAIDAIHRTFEEAEHQLSQLGGQLQFLISPGGEVEIVRRDKSGEAERPKSVIAELKGCDPMLWRGDCPAWLEVLSPRRDPILAEASPSDSDAPADEPDPDPQDADPGADDPSRDTCQPCGEPSTLET